MAVIDDANTLLSWSATTMTADGTDASSISALLPVRNNAGFTAVSDAYLAIESQLLAQKTEAWDAMWGTAQDQIWSEVPTVSFDSLMAGDIRIKRAVKRLMSITSLARCRKLVLG